MAQIVNLLALLKRLMTEELRSLSSVGLNNLLFCTLIILWGSHRPQDAFWSTLLFQLVLLAPLLVSVSIDTQHRLPPQRVANWPLTDAQKLCFSTISFFLSPLFLVLFFGFLLWMGLAIGLVFLSMGFVVHLLVYGVGRLLAGVGKPVRLLLPSMPWKASGIALETWSELSETLDFWAALLFALLGTLYRAFGRSPDPQAFPILSMIVALAMSTVAQRMLSLDEGRALLRYRLLPIAGWKVLLAQDAAFLLTVAVLVSPLNLRAGCTCGLASLAVGRYPSVTQRVSQRRWRFVGGDFRFGIGQVLLGVLAGLGALRVGLWPTLIAVTAYLLSLLWGELLWRRHVLA